MRRAALRAAAALPLLLALLLAGCSSLEPAAAPPEAGPKPVTAERAVTGDSFAAKPTCLPPGPCVIGVVEGPLRLEVLANETLHGLDLTLTGDQEATIAWNLTCDGRPCGLPSADGPLPLHANATGLDLPGPFLVVATFARTDGSGSITEGFVGLHLAGTFAVLRDPRPAYNVTTVVRAGAFDDTTGACALLVDPACTGWPDRHEAQFEDTLARLRANVTWDARTPLSGELSVEVTCIAPGGSYCTGTQPFTVTGTSPLAIDQELQGWAQAPGEDAPLLGFQVFENATFGPEGLQQPYHLDWTMEMVRLEPTDVQAPRPA